MSSYENILKFFENRRNNLFAFFENRKLNILNFVDEFKKTPDMQNSVLKYGIFIGIIISIIIIFYYASIDPKSMTSNKYLYFLSIAIPLIIGVLYIIPFNSNNALYKILLGFLLVSLIVTVIYFYSTTNIATSIFINYLMNFLTFAIIICAMAIFLYVFTNYLKSLKGTSGFIAYLLFYIPCLLIDFVRYIINEFKMTTNEIYILFLIEIALILVYIYLPSLISKILENNSIVLMKDSAFLDIEKVIGNSEQFKMPQKMTDNLNYDNPSYRKDYSISMWVYLNSQTSSYMANSQEKPIFDYGNGKPKITYMNNLKNSDEKDILVFYFTNIDSNNHKFEYQISKQNWHQIVFNYSSDYVNLFIDGNLVNTHYFEKDMPSYLPTDEIKIGSTNGLDGAISNIIYYKNIQSKSQISNSYNLLYKKNPPTMS
jgi:hypothetical protein